MKYLKEVFQKTLVRTISTLHAQFNWIPALIIFLFLSIIFSSCLKEKLNNNPDDLTNQQKMHRLNIQDPFIWNSLATQSIQLPNDEDSLTKSAQVSRIQEYPKGENYYFALFEDLFPSEGDYDFNDVMIRSKLNLEKRRNTVRGFINSTLLNRGGSLPLEIGLMFYEVQGNKYTRISNKNISYINSGKNPPTGSEPWSIPLDELGDSWSINFSLTQKRGDLWINYFIKTTEGEIMTSGFAPPHVEEFTLPHPSYLTEYNLPWGLEIETDELAIPNEKELFLNAYPAFEEWAKSGGTKNKKWYESPDPDYTWK